MENIKTLIFNGSPRKQGDTIALINELKNRLHGEVKIVSSYNSSIKPCTDCRHCWKTPECIIKDSMQEIYEYIIKCDNIVIASPIYFSELSGSLLNILSRLQLFCAAKIKRQEYRIKKRKKGAIILCGGGDGDPNKAKSTAHTVLKQMNSKKEDFAGYALSHNTDELASKHDLNAIMQIEKIANDFNELNNHV